MKIKDIVSESYKGSSGRRKDFGSVKQGIDQSMPNVMIEPEVSDHKDPYMQMRYGIALAAAAAHSDDDFEQESAWSDHLALVGYTDAEVEQIKAADKLMGVKSIKSSGKSKERIDTGTKSAVASGWKKFAK
jgi:hypothetical protein